MKKTQGFYFFADGTKIWFNALSASEKRKAEMEHGKVLKFVPTNF